MSGFCCITAQKTMDTRQEKDDEFEETVGERFIEETKNPDNIPRETWSNKRDFILACVGMSVGIGNLWRFPYLCYKNGGGAFLIPFLTFVVLGGVPMFILELALGQYMSLSGFKAWNICPVFRGIGIANIIIDVFANIYYIMVLAWAAYFFVISLTSVLPWSDCNNAWNTPRCTPFHKLVETNSSAIASLINSSVTAELPVDPAVEFWERRVLQLTKDITDGGGIIWELALSLLVVWVIVYFCVWRGVRWMGKVVYFTAIFPYVILCVLLVRGLTLDGATDGIVFYLKPDLSRLADIQVWMDGGTQVFYSYAIALNQIITLGSYNKFTNNFYRDAILVSCINSGTSLVGGFAVFSVLGFMAKQHNIPIADVANAGPGLAFISYPNAVTQMPISPLWAALFFLMIILLGLDSQFVGVETVIAAVMDMFPNLVRRGSRRMLLMAVYCFLSFLVGLPLVSRGGMYIFQLFDYYAASGMVLLWVVFWEVVAIAWVFGADRFYDAIEMMIGSRINPYLYFCWKYLSPVLCMGLLLSQLVEFRPLTYNKTYVYPDWAQAFGIMLALSSMLCIPVYGLFKMAITDGSLIVRWRKVTMPILRKNQIHPSWGATTARQN
ncbi:sodium- and chloride-dependent creatine transporter 1-like isoform X2 [Mizuhopecten yessoensis]|uniref:sodium- and chloride-dependent creatine transporter 1-like isoform X2 n=1 Tax=Mizuhopecten yessoensis TaxID=6573 RepID=UPI000B45A74A|nr:sodium- and chloride-dependent creatine transporter 1-like isoform X2 [Mizuhopecten yessoensis]